MPIALIPMVVIIANVNMVGLAMVTKIVLLSWMKMENVQMTFVTKLNVKSEFSNIGDKIVTDTKL